MGLVLSLASWDQFEVRMVSLPPPAMASRASARSIRARPPMDSPTRIAAVRMMVSSNGSGGSAGREGAARGVARALIARARTSLVRTKTKATPNGGNRIIAEPIRAKTTKKTKRLAGISSASMADTGP